MSETPTLDETLPADTQVPGDTQPNDPPADPLDGYTGPLVLEWDAELREQVLRPATDEELADIAARQSAPIDREALIRQIDADVDALYARVIGNRAAEYEQAEREAAAYAQGGYTGPVPGMVVAWALAKGWTGQQAADDIVAQAAAWRTAQTAIRAARLLRKELIRASSTTAEVDASMADWAQFLAYIRAQLGVT